MLRRWAARFQLPSLNQVHDAQSDPPSETPSIFHYLFVPQSIATTPPSPSAFLQPPLPQIQGPSISLHLPPSSGSAETPWALSSKHSLNFCARAPDASRVWLVISSTVRALPFSSNSVMWCRWCSLGYLPSPAFHPGLPRASVRGLFPSCFCPHPGQLCSLPRL